MKAEGMKAEGMKAEGMKAEVDISKLPLGSCDHLLNLIVHTDCDIVTFTLFSQQRNL